MNAVCFSIIFVNTQKDLHDRHKISQITHITPASQAPSQILSLSALSPPSFLRKISCMAARKLALSGKTSLPILRTGTRQRVIPRAVRSGRGRMKGCSQMEKGVWVRYR
jgi:hypothetical protein